MLSLIKQILIKIKKKERTGAERFRTDAANRTVNVFYKEVLFAWPQLESISSITYHCCTRSGFQTKSKIVHLYTGSM